VREKIESKWNKRDTNRQSWMVMGNISVQWSKHFLRVECVHNTGCNIRKFEYVLDTFD
jgi:hypothetical protein